MINPVSFYMCSSDPNKKMLNNYQTRQHAGLGTVKVRLLKNIDPQQWGSSDSDLDTPGSTYDQFYYKNY